MCVLCCLKTIETATQHDIAYGMNNHRFTIILTQPDQGRLAGQHGLDTAKEARSLDLKPLGLPQGFSPEPTIGATDSTSLQKTNVCP
jgi:hypothetical protein